MIINGVDVPVFRLMKDTFIDLLDIKPQGITDGAVHNTIVSGLCGTIANNVANACRDIIREGTRSSNVTFVLRSLVNDSGMNIPSNAKTFALALFNQMERDGGYEQPRPGIYWKELVRTVCDALSSGTIELKWSQNESIHQ